MSDFGNAPPPPYGEVPAQQPYGQSGPIPADMGIRLVARIIDVVLIGIVLGVLGAVLLGGAATQLEVDPVTGQITEGGESFFAAYFGYIVLASVIGFLYEVAFIALRGATIGKQLMKIRVVREDNGGLPGWGPSVLRWLIPWLGSFVCGIGQIVVYLSPFWDPTKRYQGWHDKVAKTLVVKA